MANAQKLSTCVKIIIGMLTAALALSLADPVIAAGPAAVAGGYAAPTDAQEILNTASYLRFYAAYRPATIPTGKDGSPGGLMKMMSPAPTGIAKTQTPPPPETWTSADFDDREWGRGFAQTNFNPANEHNRCLPGTSGQALHYYGLDFTTGLLCFRGKFTVTDPATVKGIYLSLGYRGGVVVYLNGKQVAVKDMPDGNIAPTTPASPYPDDAYLDAAGKMLPDWGHGYNRLKDEPDLADRFSKRDRTLAANIPTDALRKGVNVLAIEVHRSDYHWIALKQEFPGGGMNMPTMGWIPCGLLDIHLAASGTGVISNTSRPAGLQVWNEDINNRVMLSSYGDPNEKNFPLILAGARNGYFSGQLVAASTKGLPGLRVAASDLKPAGGVAGTIPADHVQIRFGRCDAGSPELKNCWYFDGLMDSPPKEYAVPTNGGFKLLQCAPLKYDKFDEAKPVAGGAIVPVWVTVNVPKDTAAGQYRGTITISVAGEQDATVPMQLTVANWTIPDPQAFRTYMGLYESPTSVALQYKVKPWSEEHWKLLDKSFALLSQVGNQFANIEVVDKTQFGNEEGMLYWIKKEDGTYDYDFTVIDRYLALVKKYLGVPENVGLQIWHAGGWEARKADQENTVVVIDKKTGEHSHMQVPAFDSKEAKEFWKPALEACRDHLAKVGMEKSMCIGMLSDSTAPSSVFAMFDSIWPGGAPARWMRGCHGQNDSKAPYRVDKGGGLVVLHEHCYGIDYADPAKPLPAIWTQRAMPAAAFCRDCYEDRVSLFKYRSFSEYGLYVGKKGIGRICLDFWPGVGPTSKNAADNNYNSIYNRYPFSSCAQRAPVMYHLSYAGPDGAAATIRFELMREGLQAAEATIIIAEAQATKADKLGAELAGRCKQTYADRVDFLRLRTSESGYFYTTFATGWSDLDARTFAAAAEVADKTK